MVELTSGRLIRAWPHLGNQDAILRHAARIALESQPADVWQERALAEHEPRAALAALLGAGSQWGCKFAAQAVGCA